MIDTRNSQTNRNWSICPREENHPRWMAPYATLNGEGDIVISRFTHESLGPPEAYILLYDRETMVIGIKAARPTQKEGYPAKPRGRHGGRRIRGYRLCREFGIKVTGTIRFPRAHVDRDGILIMDLKDVKPASHRTSADRPVSVY